MKTKGLNYLEAVRALDDGKCEKIQSSGGACYEKNSIGIIVFVEGLTKTGILLSPSVFLDEWSLMGVKQKAVFSGVKWHKAKDDCIYPTTCGSNGFEFYEMEDKPAMKMTLEWIE